MTFKIAFAKGRGAADVMRLMEPSGARFPAEVLSGRLTVHRAPTQGFDAFVVRGDDVPALLSSGAIDVAIASSIVFEEHERDASRAVSRLGIGECRLSVIARDGVDVSEKATVYTRYPRVCRRRLETSTWRIKKWHGCVEASMFLGISDAIVDIVETGWTLHALALRERRVLCNVGHEIRIRPDRDDVIPRLRQLFPTVDWS